MRRCEFCNSPVPADAIVCPVCRREIAEETLERVLPFLKRPAASEFHVTGAKERIWGVIRRPATTYKDIGKNPDRVGPLLIVFFNALLMGGIFIAISSKFQVTYVVNATPVTANVLLSPYSSYFGVAALLAIAINILVGIIYLFGGSLFAHIAFKVTGGTGSFRKTVSIVGYSVTPVLFVRALAILVVLSTLPLYDVTQPASWQSVITDIYFSSAWYIIDDLTALSFVWVGFLLIFGIREAHNTSTLWATIVSIACMIVLYWTFWQVH